MDPRGHSPHHWCERIWRCAHDGTRRAVGMPPMPDAFSPIALQFQYAAAQWFPVLFSAAQWVFSILLIVEVVQLCIMRLGTMGFWFPVLMQRLVTVVFFQWILLHAQTLLPRAINGFMDLGRAAGGVPTLQPQEVVMHGLVLMTEMIA